VNRGKLAVLAVEGEQRLRHRSPGSASKTRCWSWSISTGLDRRSTGRG